MTGASIKEIIEQRIVDAVAERRMEHCLGSDTRAEGDQLVRIITRRNEDGKLETHEELSATDKAFGL
jgi:hypothetical protein